MRFSPEKTIPAVMTIASVGWSSWAYIEPARAPETTTQAVSEVTNSLLSPSLLKQPSRDPFSLGGEAAEKAALAEKSAAAKSQPKNGALATNKTASSNSNPRAEMLRCWAREIASKFEQSRRLASDRESISKQFVLSGTSVRGQRRIAVIGEHVYQEGDTIESGGKSLTAPVLLERVLAHSVVLRYRQALVEIGFPMRPSHSISSQPPAIAAAAPARSRQPASKNRTSRGVHRSK